jgi:prophage tail gpP-like protein
VAYTDEVKVTLPDGTEVDTWETYQVTLDMLNPGSAWTLSLYDSRDRQSTWEVLQEKALAGTKVTLAVHDAVQLTGRIEHREVDAGPEGTTMVLSGRDLAGPLMSSEADVNIHLRNTTLGDALVRLTQGTDVELFIAQAAAASECHSLRNRRRSMSSRRQTRSHSVDLFKIQPGMKIWQAANLLCRKSGYMIWTAPHPGSTAGVAVIIDKPLETGSAKFQLKRELVDQEKRTYRGNILRSKEVVNIREVPTKVVGFGHTAANANDDSRNRSVVLNEGLSHRLVDETMLPNVHYLTVHDGRTAAKVQRAAERVIAEAMAEFLSYEYTVQGHHQEIDNEHRIYAVNTIAHVKDDRYGVDENMLITRVNFVGGRQTGQVTTIRCVPLGQVRVVPES